MAKTKYEDGKTSVWGTRKLGGYAGVKHTAKEIVEKIPDINKYKLYVEPFSGLGRTAEHIKIPMILNDKSAFANDYCKEHFPNAIVENMDFWETIKRYDSPDTFFMIDPPWQYFIYSDNDLAFCDRQVYEYYDTLLKVFDDIKGDWFLLSSVDEHEQRNIIRKSKWGLIIVDSEKNVIFGNKARTMICSNLFDSNYKQEYIAYRDEAKRKPLGISTERDITLEKDVCNICFAKYDNYEEHIKRQFHKEYI